MAYYQKPVSREGLVKFAETCLLNPSVLGRKLKLDDSTIEQIEFGHRHDRYEQIYQMLLKWKQACPNATWKDLEEATDAGTKRALRDLYPNEPEEENGVSDDENGPPAAKISNRSPPIPTAPPFELVHPIQVVDKSNSMLLPSSELGSNSSYSEYDTPNSSLSSNLEVSAVGVANFRPNSSLSSNIEVNGVGVANAIPNSSLSSNIEVSGIGRNSFRPNSSLSSNLEINGVGVANATPSSLSSNIEVMGMASFRPNSSLSSNLEVNGVGVANAIPSSLSSNLEVMGVANFRPNPSLSSNLEVNGVGMANTIPNSSLSSNIEDSGIGRTSFRSNSSLSNLEVNCVGMANSSYARVVCDSPIENQELTYDNDYMLVLEMLGHEIRWYELGLALRLKPSLLEEIKESNRDRIAECRKEMVKEWLKNPHNSYSPSWRSLCKALRVDLVGNKALANQIARKYNIKL